MGRRYKDDQHVQRLDQGVLQASTSQAYFSFTSDQTFVSKGSFEMKRIIITFTLMLATTSALAQLSPDQMREEMAKSDGHKMCPSNNEYLITPLRKACGGGGNGNAGCGSGSDFDQACG